MENLNIEKTKYTPQISLNAQEGVLEFKGKSYPENTFEFYAPVQKWIESYIATCETQKVVIVFDINYLNSSSIKFYYDLFDTLEEATNDGKDIEVQWLYDKEDDMALESGEEFQEDYEDLNMTLVEKS